MAEPAGRRTAAGHRKRTETRLVHRGGVVKTVKQTAWSEPPTEEMYFSVSARPRPLSREPAFVCGVSDGRRAHIIEPGRDDRVRGTRRAIDRTCSGRHQRDDDGTAIGTQLVAPRFYMVLLGMFAAVAVVLAAIGIYGVISHSVARRTHEIGLRMALGADSRRIVRHVIGRGLGLAAAGSAIGCVGALLSTKYLRTLLFGVDPIDPATFGLVVVALMTVAVIASWLPGRRASHVDPMVALRAD